MTMTYRSMSSKSSGDCISIRAKGKRIKVIVVFVRIKEKENRVDGIVGGKNTLRKSSNFWCNDVPRLQQKSRAIVIVIEIYVLFFRAFESLTNHVNLVLSFYSSVSFVYIHENFVEFSIVLSPLKNSFIIFHVHPRFWTDSFHTCMPPRLPLPPSSLVTHFYRLIVACYSILILFFLFLCQKSVGPRNGRETHTRSAKFVVGEHFDINEREEK